MSTDQRERREVSKTQTTQPRLIAHFDEPQLTHVVYGVLLTLATVGELIDHDAEVRLSLAWLLGGGAVLLAAHTYSAILAYVSKTSDDVRWPDAVQIAQQELSVVIGAVGASAIVATAALLNLSSARALWLCVALGLGSVAALAFFASSKRDLVPRLVMAGGAVALGATIVILEIQS